MIFLELAWLGLATLCTAQEYMEQSFFFEYAPSTQNVPVPVTSQCETIHISWDRGSATGPNPSAPYYLQVYTSAFVFPFIIEAGSGLSFDWQVPFGPGTIYEMCMFDKNGYTGGCQRQYTMIANTTVDDVTCANATFPLGPLEIDAQVENGPLGMYSWVNQCTDISITPKNGTAPYILTIAPTSHPPMNITIEEKSQTTNWTIDLSWSTSFFISVVDADFNYWSYGPLHSGGDGPTACLAQGDLPESNSTGISSGAAAGVGIGALFGGLLFGITGTYFLLQNRTRRGRHSVRGSSPDSFHTREHSGHDGHRPRMPMLSVNGSHASRSEYLVEPFRLPGDSHNTLLYANSESPLTPATRLNNQIYVVHHDGGRAPVTVYHEDGTEVVELPPRYINEDGSIRTPNTAGSEGVSEGTTVGGAPRSQQPAEFFNQPRQAGSNPRKLQPNRRLTAPQSPNASSPSP